MTTMSLQLPDLLSYCSVFALQTNRHCRRVSQASEKWLLESGITLSAMTWGAAKPGLLAAACHPNADATQLRFVTDFLSILVYQRVRGVDRGDAGMFAPLWDRLARVAYGDPWWYLRFLRDQRTYLAARVQLAENSARGVVPDLESYIDVAGHASGFRMALAMVQYAGDVRVPEVLWDEPLFAQLHTHASDIAAWSADIVTCAQGVPEGPNLVTVLARERRVPFACAVAMAGTLVKQSVDAFVATEEALVAVSEVADEDEARRYRRGLRDWMAGFVNWLYETELFLGDKGNEVRAFGWVFVPVA